jgi:hypothetical protein
MIKALTSFMLACVLCANQATAQGETKEERDESFFQGMEQGFFLRNDLQGHKQFECPDLVVDSAAQRQFS